MIQIDEPAAARAQGGPEVRSGLRVGCVCLDFSKHLTVCYDNNSTVYTTPHSAEGWLKECRKKAEMRFVERGP